MSETPHTIPDHVAARVSRLINEAEDMRQQAADDLKQIYADLREELRGMGWTGSVVSAEVSALKGAIAEIRLDDEKKAKREEKGERVLDYVSMLSRVHAREGHPSDRGGSNPDLNPSAAHGAGASAAPIQGSVGRDYSAGSNATASLASDESEAPHSHSPVSSLTQADQADGVAPPAPSATPADERYVPDFLRRQEA